MEYQESSPLGGIDHAPPQTQEAEGVRETARHAVVGSELAKKIRKHIDQRLDVRGLNAQRSSPELEPSDASAKPMSPTLQVEASNASGELPVEPMKEPEIRLEALAIRSLDEDSLVAFSRRLAASQVSE